MKPEDIISRKSDYKGNIIVELYETDLIELMKECDSTCHLLGLAYELIESTDMKLEEAKAERDSYLSCIKDIEKLMGHNIHDKD